MNGARSHPIGAIGSTSLRDEQAELTRSRVLAAATGQFATRGYRDTTLSAVASAAGVSVQTVYNVLGGKAELLRAACTALRAPGGLWAGVHAAADAPTARACLRRYTAAVRESDEDALPLLCVLTAQAAAGDRDLAAAVAALDDERAAGTNALATHVHDHFGLREGLDVDTAADILWALTAPEVADRLTRGRGWGWGKFENWLADTAAEALLGPHTAEESDHGR